MNLILQFEIASPNERLDVLLLTELRKKAPHISRNNLKTLFEEGRVLLHGKPALASLRLPLGAFEVEFVSFDLSETPLRARASTRGCFLPIVYEDNALIVLHKNSGTPSLPHSPAETETAVGAALAHFPDLYHPPGKGLEPGLLHRLDTLTSGLLAFAKSKVEYEKLRAAWKSGQVKKIYRAISVSSPDSPPPPHEITWPLAHDAKKAKKMVALVSGSFRPNQTRGKPLQALTRIKNVRPMENPLARDLEIEIETGVMHQIRCHLAAAHWPVAGDPIYGGNPAPRLWLHAWKLTLPLSSGQLLSLQAALPSDWPSHQL